MRKLSPAHPTLFPTEIEVPAPAPVPQRAARTSASAAPKPPKAAAAPAPKPAKASVAHKPAKAAPAPKPPKTAAPKTAAPKTAASKTAASKTAASKTAAAPKRAKAIPVQAAAPPPPAPVRVVSETNGAGGRAWRMSSRYAIAYIKDAALAGELLATDARHLAKIAMAVYYDRKGKAFAWQVRFDAARWDEVVRRLA